MIVLWLATVAGLGVALRGWQRTRKERDRARQGLELALADLRGDGPPCGKPSPLGGLGCCVRSAGHEGRCAFIQDAKR